MKELKIKKSTADFWNRLLKEAIVNFEALGVPQDATLFIKTVKFDDGAFADLQVCSGQTNLWCEMVWFDENGCEICCSDACADHLEGEWQCEDDAYSVKVIAVEDAELARNHEYELHVGHFGNGELVYNVQYEEHGEYEHIAHISDDGNISWRKQKNFPQDVIEWVEKEAKNLASQEVKWYYRKQGE